MTMDSELYFKGAKHLSRGASIQINSGHCKGTKLKVPKSARPTRAIVRKSVFDSLRLESFSFLDLYAGSGIMGLEAISRGANQSDFVEKDPEAIKTLRENLALVSARFLSQSLTPPSLHLICEDALSFIKKIKRSYDVIWADPPYEYYNDVLEALRAKAPTLLNESGWLIIEGPIAQIQMLSNFKQKNFGQTGVVFFRKDEL